MDVTDLSMHELALVLRVRLGERRRRDPALDRALDPLEFSRQEQRAGGQLRVTYSIEEILEILAIALTEENLARAADEQRRYEAETHRAWALGADL